MIQLIAYSPPYGENYFKEFEVFSFMHSCGIDTIKLILSNTFSRMGIPYSPYPPIWPKAGEYDFTVVDRQINDILQYNPAARFIAMIDLNSPPWLAKALGKDSFLELGECFLDSEWLRQVSDYQDALTAYLEKNYADSVDAYYVACGRTQEWFDLQMFSPTPLRTANYRKWCTEHGKVPLALPQEGEYDRYKDALALPEHLVQWKEYGNSLTAECAAYFFKRIRSKVRSEVSIGGVFGNIHDLGSSGHLNAEWFYHEATPDFYIGPSCNSEIPMGGASGFQSAQLMLKRYGISYLHSCDRQLSTTETEIGKGIRVPPHGIQARQKNAAEDIACLKREFAIALVHGFSLWFFNIWGGAYRGAEVRLLLQQFGTLWKDYAKLSSGSDAETLLVFSPEAALHCRCGDDMLGSQLRRRFLPEAGIPFTTAILNDLYETDLSPFKLIIFLCTDYLSERDLKMIQERVCRAHRVVVWCNQPGVANEHGIDKERMERICGVPFGRTGKGEKQFACWKSVVFRGADSCTPEALRAAGMDAGLHFFTDAPDLKVWSSPQFLSAHTCMGGIKTLSLKRKVKRITEIFSGIVKGENTDRFTDEFAAPDTKLYFLE